jgi:hypothetical protein
VCTTHPAVVELLTLLMLPQAVRPQRTKVTTLGVGAEHTTQLTSRLLTQPAIGGPSTSVGYIKIPSWYE